MPAIHREPLLRAIESVGRKRHEAAIGIGIGFIMPVIVEIVSAAEIILGSGAADGGIFAVSVKEELDFSLTPPATVVASPCHIRADIVSLPCHTVENRVTFHIRKGIGTAVLRMEVDRVGGNLRPGIIDLIPHTNMSIRKILKGNTAMLPERHLPVAIHAVLGIDADGKRGHRAMLGIVRRGEEVGKGTLDRRLLLSVPVNTKGNHPPRDFRKGQPDMLNHSGTVDLRHRVSFSCADHNRRRDFPPLSQVTGAMLSVSVLGAAADALLALAAVCQQLHGPEHGGGGGHQDAVDELGSLRQALGLDDAV